MTQGGNYAGLGDPDPMERWIHNLGIFKYVKESYLVQVAEYAHQRKLSDEPAFAWWVPHVLKKREIIIAKVESK